MSDTGSLPFLPKQTLDLRLTKCPLNFVQTKLALEKLDEDDVLEVWILTGGESAINIPQSIQQEGHEILATITEGTIQKLMIQKKNPVC